MRDIRERVLLQPASARTAADLCGLALDLLAGRLELLPLPFEKARLQERGGNLIHEGQPILPTAMLLSGACSSIRHFQLVRSSRRACSLASAERVAAAAFSDTSSRSPSTCFSAIRSSWTSASACRCRCAFDSKRRWASESSCLSPDSAALRASYRGGKVDVPQTSATASSSTSQGLPSSRAAPSSPPRPRPLPLRPGESSHATSSSGSVFPP